MSEKGTSQEKDSSYTKKITAYPWGITLDQIDALARQRRREQPSDLQRVSMHIGALFISIQGERGPDGKYGLWSAEVILEQIRSWTALSVDWLADQGRPRRGVEGSGSLTALMEVLVHGGFPQGGTMYQGDLFSTDSRSSSHSSANTKASDLQTGTKDFVLDPAIGADLDLDDTEIL